MDAFTKTTIVGWVLLIVVVTAWYLIHLHWKRQERLMIDRKNSTQLKK